jgi:hypothetical protein
MVSKSTSGSNGKSDSQSQAHSDPREELYVPLIIAALTMVLALAVFSYGSATKRLFLPLPGWDANMFTVFSVGLLVLATTTLIGGFFGFLFALPRDLSRLVPAAPLVHKDGSAPSQPDGEDLPDALRTGWANNNLIKVSDWLTTLIVGVGLVEFNSLVGWVGDTGAMIGAGAGLRGSGLQTTFGVTNVVTGSAFGFLTGYVYTRTTVTRRLALTTRQVEAALQKQLEDTNVAIDSMQSDLKIAKERNDFVQRQFEGTASVFFHLYRPPPEGFTAAIKEVEHLFKSKPDLEKNSKLWAYLALAHGQSYRFEREKPDPDRKKLQEIADSAYSAIERCLKIDPDQRHWLQTTWNPDDPGFTQIDDDLTEFYEDEEQRMRFAKLLQFNGDLP